MEFLNVNYAERLQAVSAALQEAERASRFGEAEALRMARSVLTALLEERGAATVNA